MKLMLHFEVPPRCRYLSEEDCRIMSCILLSGWCILVALRIFWSSGLCINICEDENYFMKFWIFVHNRKYRWEELLKYFSGQYMLRESVEITVPLISLGVAVFTV
jgi:hypothetical protein